MILLGTAEEKTAWKKASDDIARRMFIEGFWRQRDPNPDTEENEYRSDFQRRVAFADHMFVTEKTRGSLTDRGRVFVLFGPPRIVRQSNLAGFDAQNTMDKRGPVAPAQPVNPQDALTAGARAIEESNRRMASGTIAPVVKGKSERWLYGREQLPKGFPEDYLAFKFITQEGYGENVLQRDPLVLKAMMDAAHVAH
jgi:GWxTD domain-containing protein